jgi:hypothetical protein
MTPCTTGRGDGGATIPLTADALIRAWAALSRAEDAIDWPFTRAASCALDRALVALADLEEQLEALDGGDWPWRP